MANEPLPPFVNPHPPPKLIDLKNSMGQPMLQRILDRFAPPIEKFLSIDKINLIYQRCHGANPPATFLQECLDQLNVRYHLSEKDTAKIPPSGPLVVVANHPFGALEGVVLGHIFSEFRHDVKILGNYFLARIPELRPMIISVDPFGSKKAAFKNARAFKAAIDWLNTGGVLITFPAGEVSHINLRRARVTDSKWSPHVAGLVRRTRSRVLPLYISGRNSALFQLLGLLHPILRTLFLPHELANKENKIVRICLGRPIPWARLKNHGDDDTLVDYLRINTYFLSNRLSHGRRCIYLARHPSSGHKVPDNIAPGARVSLLRREVQGLPKRQRLITNPRGDVYVAQAHQIPILLREIGRLRELTFRAVNEGTHKALDCDRFDGHYFHLFLWNKKSAEVVGAYRLGLTGDILDRFGPNGLYTHTLFQYQPDFFGLLRNAVELGRSFIRPEYQKKHSSLTLLWRGIGEFVVRHEGYHSLFGAVSISSDYHAVSKDLMIRFLKREKTDSRLARQVKPRRPYHLRRIGRRRRMSKLSLLKNLEDVSFLISELEADGKGVPVLIRQYLNLNAKFLSFNVDDKFSDAVDSLIFVDLRATEPKLLKRFMGERGYRKFKGFTDGDPSGDNILRSA